MELQMQHIFIVILIIYVDINILIRCVIMYLATTSTNYVECSTDICMKFNDVYQAGIYQYVQIVGFHIIPRGFTVVEQPLVWCIS